MWPPGKSSNNKAKKGDSIICEGLVEGNLRYGGKEVAASKGRSTRKSSNCLCKRVNRGKAERSHSL